MTIIVTFYLHFIAPPYRVCARWKWPVPEWEQHRSSKYAGDDQRNPLGDDYWVEPESFNVGWNPHRADIHISDVHDTHLSRLV